MDVNLLTSIRVSTQTHARKILLLVIVLVACAALFYVINDVVRTDKPFSVGEMCSGSEEITSSEEIAFSEGLRDAGLINATSSTYTLTVVNASGVPELASRAALTLVERGYRVEEVRWDDGRILARTVVVFDQSVQDKALEISSLFGDVPISSAPEHELTPSAPSLTLYIGKDQNGME